MIPGAGNLVQGEMRVVLLEEAEADSISGAIDRRRAGAEPIIKR